MTKIILCAAMLCGSIALLPNSAGAEQLRADRLPDGSKFPVSRRKVQIVNEAPEVTYQPPLEDETIWEIDVPTARQANTKIRHISAPGTASGGMMASGNPGTVFIGKHFLPQSGFGGTNIPAHGIVPRTALPDGTSSNALMGRMLGPKSPALVASSASAPPPIVSTAPPVLRINEYAPLPSSGTSSNRTTADARGKLLNAK